MKLKVHNIIIYILDLEGLVGRCHSTTLVMLVTVWMFQIEILTTSFKLPLLDKCHGHLYDMETSKISLIMYDPVLFCFLPVFCYLVMELCWPVCTRHGCAVVAELIYNCSHSRQCLGFHQKHCSTFQEHPRMLVFGVSFCRLWKICQGAEKN